MNTLWQQAASFAANAHKHQTRNDGTPYVAHPFRVAMTISLRFDINDEEVLAAALLHDVIEDCDVDYDDVCEQFGSRVADLVAVMTKDMRLEEMIREVAYDKQLADGPWEGRLIKLADVYDNFVDADSAHMQSKMKARATRIITLTKSDGCLQEPRQQLAELVEGAKTC
ncbi:MAG: HD domain-containing protein [Planctomycetota bacterium]|nr:HD domain-containing protein [Planctomycetota bacterium]